MKCLRYVFGVFILGCVRLLAAGNLYENTLLEAPPAEEGWMLPQEAQFTPAGLVLELPAKAALCQVSKPFDPRLFAGKLLKISAEAATGNVLPGIRSYEGAALQFTMLGAGKRSYGGIKLPNGTRGWKTYSSVFHAPSELDSITLKLLFQNSAGKVAVRNLTIGELGIAVNIPSVANMGISDPVAGDGVGGWTDQGPEKDARAFAGMLYARQFAQIPLATVPDGKNVLVMYSEHYFPAGPKAVDIPVKTPEKSGFLYLLHTAAWSAGEVGSVTLIDVKGKTQTIPIRHGVDVYDWYRNIAFMPNGFPALRAKSGDGQPIAAYVSKFPVDPALAEIASVTFRSGGRSVWLILAATLTELDIPLPEQKKFTVRAGDRWLPFAYAPGGKIRAGSALDLEKFMPRETVDQSGRIVIRNGKFVREKQPDRPVRFMTCAVNAGTALSLSPEELDAYAQEVRRNGYNMIRTHFLDSALLEGASEPLEFNPRVLDRFDYFVAAMKKNGLYLNFDLMTSWIGYTPGNVWKNRDPLKSFKHKIAFDPAVRENWSRGVEKILCRVNPYTGTRLIDDPVLAMAVGFNEQEFGFWELYDEKLVAPHWRAFLRKRYGGIGNLKKAWGQAADAFRSFDDVPPFKTTFAGEMINDAEIFRNECERETLEFYRSEMKRMGYRGEVTGFNCGKSQTYNMTRLDAPFVAMNAYHAHPNAYINRNSSLSQQSPSEVALNFFRGFICTRQPLKPFMVTEHCVVFWNKYRYEQAFATGAYAALQDFDSLTAHAAPVNFKFEHEIQPFVLSMDPVAKASEFLTFFLFMRGDVTPARPCVRIRVDEKEVFAENGPKGGLPTEQSLLALTTGVSVEPVGADSPPLPLRSGEIAFRIGKPDVIIVNRAGYSATVDNPAASAAEVIALLKERGLLAAGNRSDGRKKFESDNGEIFLDSTEKRIEINTPRLQGVSAVAGTQAKLPDFEILNMSCNGNLACVSIDGRKNIFDAGRLMLVYATNALNSEMTFTGPEMDTLVHIGKMPPLLERGAFTVAIRHRTPEKLRLYPLDFAGNRLKQLLPESIGGEKAIFSVDMKKDGATFFFEIEAGVEAH